MKVVLKGVVLGLYIALSLLVLTLYGCSLPQQIVKVPQAVLLSEDKIYTLPAGQMVNLELDKKPIDMTFSQDMKIVSSNFLVRQEVIKNDELLKEIKAEKDKGTRNTIIGSILSMLAALLGIFLKNFWSKKRSKFELKGEI